MAQSLFKLLQARHPGTLIDVIAPPATLPLLSRMPEIHEAIPLAIPHRRLGLRMRWALGRALRTRGYRQGLVLPQSYKSALPVWIAGIPRRTGYRGEWRLGVLNDIRQEPAGVKLPTVERFIRLGLEPDEPLPPIPIPALRADPNQALAFLAHRRFDPTQPVLALCPGAEYGPAKRWPAHHFATLTKQYLQHGWQVWLLGGHKDRPTTDAIQKSVDQKCLNLAGETTLVQVIDLLHLATAIVSNDSGLMHIAAALDRPLVALFGSSDPHHTPPLNPAAISLSLKLSCSPCFARTCPLGHLRCLEDLTPAQVSAALTTLPYKAIAPRDGEGAD